MATSINHASIIADRYLAIWHERDAITLRARIAICSPAPPPTPPRILVPTDAATADWLRTRHASLETAGQ